MRILRVACLVFLLAVLLFFAYNGLVEGSNAIRTMRTPGEKLATATQLAYGVLAVLALASVWLRPAGTTRLLVAWAVPLVVTGTLAPMVYGDRGLGIGLLGGLVALLLSGLTIWCWSSRPKATPPEISP